MATRLSVFAALGIVLCATQPARSANAGKPLQRAVDWLIAQQDKDGGWHSNTYGSMRGGASITAQVLYTFSKLPAKYQESHRKRFERALAFLRRGIAKKGFVTVPDGTLDYPAYATAMTLVAVRRLKLPLPEKEQKQLVAFLLREQRTEANGFKPKDADYGGWDLMAGSGVVGVKTSTNISITGFVLEALQPFKGTKVERARKLARGWVARCQNLPGDGGFFFHPDRNHPGNKAEWSDKSMKSPRSYGSPTCDGIHVLLNAGSKTPDKRVRAAAGWLDGQLSLKVVPGFKKSSTQAKSWEAGLRYYYYSRLAALLPLVAETKANSRREKLLEMIHREQRKNGSWKNTSARMREDDPLIATCLNLQALAGLIDSKK